MSDLEELEVLIDSLRNVEKRRVIKDVDVEFPKEFKEEVFSDLYKREFNKKYYNI